MNPKSKAKYQELTQRRGYSSPRLIEYGAVRDLTQSGTGTKTESTFIQIGNFKICRFDRSKKPCSERRVKENIVRIGDHPLGLGLYLFDYRPEFHAQWGHGRQFGVMIDEVEPVLPEAVSMHPDGYKRVDYAMLGIDLAVQQVQSVH